MRCSTAELAYAKQYRESHRGERAAYQVSYRASHREGALSHNATYRALHRDELAARQRRYYAEHREELLDKMAAYQASVTKPRLDGRRAFLDLAKRGVGCADCGATNMLDFHHREMFTKEFEISQALTKPWCDIMDEIFKCDVLCRSCHTTRHWA